MLKGLKRMQAQEGRQERQRLPISVEILGKLHKEWQGRGTTDADMLWATASLCFFGFFRSGELTVPSESSGYDPETHISVQDVCIDSLTNPQVLQVNLKASKTDPFHIGVKVYVGRTNCPLCPVAAVLSYLTRRGSDLGPLFRFNDGKYTSLANDS